MDDRSHGRKSLVIAGRCQGLLSSPVARDDLNGHITHGAAHATTAHDVFRFVRSRIVTRGSTNTPTQQGSISSHTHPSRPLNSIDCTPSTSRAAEACRGMRRGTGRRGEIPRASSKNGVKLFRRVVTLLSMILDEKNRICRRLRELTTHSTRSKQRPITATSVILGKHPDYDHPLPTCYPAAIILPTPSQPSTAILTRTTLQNAETPTR